MDGGVCLIVNAFALSDSSSHTHTRARAPTYTHTRARARALVPNCAELCWGDKSCRNRPTFNTGTKKTREIMTTQAEFLMNKYINNQTLQCEQYQ